MQQRPKILLRAGRINLPIRVPIIDLTVDSPSTFLTSDTAAASGTLTVKNITGFAINQILLIGDVGDDGSEIIKTHASTAPTGSTITLAANTVFPHSASTKVSILNFDQIEISNAPTVAGTKTVLSGMPVAVDPTSDTTNRNDLVNTSGYYFARFYNSITSAYSLYSDPAPYSGYTPLSARSIIDSSLDEINKKTSEVLSDEYAFKQIDNCQMETLRELKRWSFMEMFDTNIGVTATGIWRVAAPTDLDDQYSNKAIWNLRIGRGVNLTYVDKEKWNDIVFDVAHTTLAVSIVVGALTITLTDSNDFEPDGGTIQIGANQYAFTANNQITNVLTLSAASTTTNTAGEDVFFGASLGEPIYWTIFNGYIYWYPLIGTEFDGRNIYLDYYKSATQIQHDSDNVVLPDATIVQYYLQWKFLKKLNNGEEDSGSAAARDMYIVRREKLKQKDTLGRSFRLKPRLNTLREQYTFEQDDRRTRLGNFPNS